MKISRAAVIGDGAWGTAVALLMNAKGVRTAVWGAFPEYVEEVARTRENARFLPGVRIPGEISLTPDMGAAVDGAEILAIAAPVQHLRAVLELMPARTGPILAVSLSKGIERKTLLRSDEVVRQVLGRKARVVAVSGPSHAEEVSRGIPTSVVAASRDPDAARVVQDVLSGGTFRVYTSSDVAGVSLGGALKNVIAVAAGISDGLGFGDNTKAALITRGIKEISRLGIRMGGKAATFAGLSGIGDLIVTCASRHSRNRALGELIGRGMGLGEAMASTPKIAEGVWTSEAVVALSKKYGVEMPISEEVYRVLFMKQDVRKAVASLMGRSLKAE